MYQLHRLPCVYSDCQEPETKNGYLSKDIKLTGNTSSRISFLLPLPFSFLFQTILDCNLNCPDLRLLLFHSAPYTLLFVTTVTKLSFLFPRNKLDRPSPSFIQFLQFTLYAYTPSPFYLRFFCLSSH